jgi:hypothetical protein
MRARFYAGGPGKPTSGLAQNTKYYWGQALASGKVAVNLTGDLANSSVYVSCGSRASLYNSWIRLPGTISLSTGKLTSDSAMALPTGTYDVCIKATVTAQTQTTNGNTTVGWSGSPATETYTVYKIMTGQLLRFKGNASPYFDLSSTTADVGSTSTCSGADWT